jgi:hypothetical protein
MIWPAPKSMRIGDLSGSCPSEMRPVRSSGKALFEIGRPPFSFTAARRYRLRVHSVDQQADHGLQMPGGWMGRP